jgi:hypothetical protein
MHPRHLFSVRLVFVLVAGSLPMHLQSPRERMPDGGYFLPQIGAALNPLFRSTVRGGYKIGEKTREMVAEAQEQVHDIVAEANARQPRR